MSRVFLGDYLKDSGASHELAKVIAAISAGAAAIAQTVRNAPLDSHYGAAGSTNVQGESVQKLDIISDDIINSKLLALPCVAAIVSEEQDTIILGEESRLSERFLVSHDPLDGSSNIDVNVAIGTIFGVQRLVGGATSAESFLIPGNLLQAAGYVMYGASTMLVLSVGSGVSIFSYSDKDEQFILVGENIAIPSSGKVYSCNQSNAQNWSPGVQKFLVDQRETGASLRYVGSLVADFHRTMLKGGIFLYPNDAKSPQGKLRLLYECVPIAFLAEQAGGAASNGSMRVLDIMPDAIHQRVPLYVGSKDMVAQLDEAIASLG